MAACSLVEGTTERWSIVFDFEILPRSTGNLFASPRARDFAGFVFGRNDDHDFGPDVHDPMVKRYFEQEPTNPLRDLAEVRRDESWRSSVYSYAPTPGRIGPNGRPACESIALFLARRPTSDELALLKRRAAAFATDEVASTLNSAKTPLRAVRLVCERISVASEAV